MRNLKDIPFHQHNVPLLEGIATQSKGVVIIGDTRISDTEVLANALASNAEANGVKVFIIEDLSTREDLLEAINKSKQSLVIARMTAKDTIHSFYKATEWGVFLPQLRESLVAIVNQRMREGVAEGKALMEIATGENLADFIKQVDEGSLKRIPYSTIDEEFLMWQAGQTSMQGINIV